MKLLRKAGVTSEIWQVFVRDSSSTTGAGLTGLAFNTASLTAYYHRDTDTTATAITLATMTVGTFTSSGFKEIDATNMPGWYQFCPPNAALASGAKSCAFHLKGAANMAPLPIECQLVAVDVDDTVRLGLTAIPNVAVGATGTATNGALVKWGDVLPAAPAANTIDEAWFLSDILGGRFGTAQAGGASTITLDAGASATDGRYVGYMVYLYGGTGGGLRGTGQERTITAYNGTTKVATVAQAWGTNPDNTSKFMLIVQPFANVGIWNGTFVPTPATAGIPDVNAKNWNNLATVALPLIPTVAGRTLDVSAGGEAGLDWANIGSPTTTVGLSGTTVGVVTLTTTTTTLTNLPAITANWLTAAGIAASALNGKGDWLLSSSYTAPDNTSITAIKAKTDNLPASPAEVGSAMTLSSAYDFAKGTVAVTESYNADGAAPTPVQALMVIMQMMTELSFVSTTGTVKKLDGIASAFTLTIDSATTPTSITRAT